MNAKKFFSSRKKKSIKKKIAAFTGGSFGVTIVAFIAMVGLALVALMTVISIVFAPIREVNKARRQAIYDTCAAYSGSDTAKSKYTDEYLNNLPVEALALEGVIRRESLTYDNEIMRVYFPLVSEAQMNAYYEGNYTYPYKVVTDESGKEVELGKLGKYGSNMEEYALEPGCNTLFFSMANDTYDYRMPWEYILATSLAYEYSDPEIFNAMLSAKLDTIRDDGTWDTSKEGIAKYLEAVKRYSTKAFDFLSQAAGFSEGKLNVSDADMNKIWGDMSAYAKEGLIPLKNYQTTIKYFGYQSQAHWQSAVVRTSDDSKGQVYATDIIQDLMGDFLLDKSELVSADLSMDRLKSSQYIKKKDGSEVMPYITYSGHVYPTILIRSVENYCSSYSEFDYAKVTTSDFVYVGDEKVYNTTYKLVHYKKTYNIQKVLDSWTRAGIGEDMYPCIFELLHTLCSETGNSVYNELYEAYNYYITKGTELVIEYYSSDPDVLSYVAEYRKDGSSYRSMAKNGTNLLGNRIDSKKLQESLISTYVSVGWALRSDQKDASPFSEDKACTWNFKSMPSIETMLTAAQVMYRYGMPFESTNGLNGEDAYVQGGSRQKYYYMTGANQAPVGYAAPMAKFQVDGTSWNLFHQDQNNAMWGMWRGHSAAHVSENGAGVNSSMTGLSSAGFVDFLLQRTLYVGRFDYRIRASSNKPTDQFCTNAYASCVNLYDYADYRFVDTSELLPGDLGFLSPVDGDDKNLVGIYVGDYFLTMDDVTTMSDYRQQFLKNDVGNKGSHQDLSDKYLKQQYGTKCHVFLVCCSSNGSTLYNGVNKVILASDNVYIPGVATMDFEYFARYCDVVSDSDNNNKYIARDFELKETRDEQNPDSVGDINYNTMPVTFTSFVEWQTKSKLTEKFNNDASAKKNNAANYIPSSDKFAAYMLMGYSDTWYEKYCKAREICRAAVHAERGQNGFDKTKNVTLYGLEEGKGAIERAITIMQSKKDDNGEYLFTEVEAVKYAYGILGYGYGVDVTASGKYVVNENVATSAGIIRQLQSGTFFIWPIQSGIHYVTGPFDYYSEEDIAALPSLAGKFHYAVDVAPVVDISSRLENGPKGEYDLKYASCDKYLAMADGVITEATYTFGGGWTVTICYSDDLNLASTYKHCNQLFVKVGDMVKQGDVVAEGGGTGSDSTGPHLHVEMVYGEATLSKPYSNRFAITDLFNYDWSSTSKELTDEEKKPKTYGKEESKEGYAIADGETNSDIETDIPESWEKDQGKE